MLSKDVINKFCKNELLQKGPRDSEGGLESLGDLLPLIMMFSRYEKMKETEKREFHQKYWIKSRDMERILKLRDGTRW